MKVENLLLNSEFKEILDQKHFVPSVSMIIPLQINKKWEDQVGFIVKTRLKNVERDLLKNYPKDIVAVLIDKCEQNLNEVKLEKNHKGVALFCSLWYQKLFYLDYYPNEKLLINDSFEIRDIVYNTKLKIPVLVLLLNLQEFRIFKFDGKILTRLQSPVPNRVEAYMQGTVRDVSIHHEKSEKKDKAQTIMIHQALQSMELINEKKDEDILIVGNHKMASEFEKHWTQSRIIKKAGNFMESTDSELQDIVVALYNDLNEMKTKEKLDELEEAYIKGLVAAGVKSIWKAAFAKNARRLFVEKDFRKSAILSPGGTEILTYDIEKAALPMIDVVDDIIEKTLLAGGEVEFMENGSIGKYERIALIKRY